MGSGTMFKQGEIVVVPFPFSDLSGAKQRPVLVLSKSKDNENSQDIITCAITSNIKDSKYSIFVDNKNLVEGEIPKPSRIKVDKLFTLDKEIIKKKIARINKETFEKVKEEFCQLI